jgi:hypothetical protein
MRGRVDRDAYQLVGDSLLQCAGPSTVTGEGSRAMWKENVGGPLFTSSQVD